jgi:cytidine deaminase
MTDRELFALAKAAAERAYAPYSGFRVGAAALTATGEVYLGANIENAAYGVTICAERVALAKAVYDGHRAFEALAVTAWPCGECRQFLSEFGAGTRVISGADEDSLESHAIAELLPRGFRL